MKSALNRLREIRSRETVPPDGPPPGHLLDPREEIAAVLLRNSYGFVWIALSPGIVPRLEAEESALSDRAAVLTPADLPRLRELPEEVQRDIIATLREFPGARVLQ